MFRGKWPQINVCVVGDFFSRPFLLPEQYGFANIADVEKDNNVGRKSFFARSF